MKPTRSLAAALVVGSALGLTVATATPAAAASIRVSPTGGLAAAGATITVSGSGFDATGNNGVGVYVVFGPRKSNFYQDANAFGAARWVHPKASGSAGQAPMDQNGSFSTTLSVKARFTDGNGEKVDCLKTQCYVLTFAAHGSADRSQDTTTPLTFQGAPAADDASDAGERPSKPATAPSPAASASASPAKTARATASSAPTGETPANAHDATTLAAVEEVEAKTLSSSDAAPAWPFWTSMGAVAVLGFGARAFTRRRLSRR